MKATSVTYSRSYKLAPNLQERITVTVEVEAGDTAEACVTAARAFTRVAVPAGDAAIEIDQAQYILLHADDYQPRYVRDAAAYLAACGQLDGAPF